MAFTSTYDYLSRDGNARGATLVLENLADAYRHSGDFAHAIEAAERAVREYSDLGMMSNALKAKSLLARTFADMGKAHQALAVIDEVLEKGHKDLGKPKGKSGGCSYD